jgi:hypothetical protein
MTTHPQMKIASVRRLGEEELTGWQPVFMQVEESTRLGGSGKDSGDCRR